ncbi:hypothetical protein KQI63_00795 [bacterium]|nr:hypothetical protein [bacterium]
MSASSIQYIPYRQDGEPPRRAAITHVEVNLDGLSEDEIQIIGHLVDAAEWMNPIFRDQFDPRTALLIELVDQLLPLAEKHEQTLLRSYLTMLNLQNSPWALLPRKNVLAGLEKSRLEELLKHLPEGDDEIRAELLELMTSGLSTPDTANFYPQDISEEEIEKIGDAIKIPNSSVIRDAEGDLYVVYNEDRYSETIAQAIKHLEAARDLTKDTGLHLYLDAKIIEMQTGFEEARRIADYTWVRHNSPIDIVISTALEVYIDNLKNFHGSAIGGVYLRNEEAEKLLNAIVERVEYWEKNAPWTFKKESIRPETLPKLKFVDVVSWAGDQVTGPFTTIAQSLPNDEWVGKEVGTVNMVYMNTGKAVHGVSGNLAAEEFLTHDEFEKVKDVLFEANQLHSALHEIGHTTGRQAPEASEGQPSNYIEEEYSFLEESRAELFGLFAVKKLVDDKIIDEKMAHACYDGMLVTMVTSMKFDPVQAHNKARNGMFHAFEKEGIISRVEEEGKTRFVVHHKKAHKAVSAMLNRVADIKAHGDKAAATALREELVFTDPLKAEIEERTADFPLGRGLVFPKLKKVDGRYTRELVYPHTFSDQEKFSLELLD